VSSSCGDNALQNKIKLEESGNLNTYKTEEAEFFVACGL
jgi:hypothetical protein